MHAAHSLIKARGLLPHRYCSSLISLHCIPLQSKLCVVTYMTHLANPLACKNISRKSHIHDIARAQALANTQ